MAFSLTKILKGILLREENTLTPREIEITPGGTAGTKTTIVSNQTANATLTLPVSTDTLVGRATTDTLTNKSIDADNNSITNIDNNEIKALAGIDATKLADGSVDNTEFQRLGAVTSAIVGVSDTQTLTNKTIVVANNTITTAASGNLTSTELNAALSELQSDIDTRATSTALTTHINNPTDAHDASAISNIPSGNLAATDVQGALNELQTDVDTRATSVALTAHTGASTGVHGVTGAVVGTTDTQTLTNKTLTSPVINTGTFDVENLTEQGSTPATPVAGIRKFYSKSDGLYQLDSNGVESKIGGSGGTGKNYLSAITTSNGTNVGNGDFELGTTSGWSLFTTTLSNGLPTTITAGAAGLQTFTTVNTGQIAAKYSLQVAAVASWASGQGFISDAMNIDAEDQAKMLSFKFAYRLLSPIANINFSGTSSNTLAIFIYDVTNGVWLQPQGVYNIVQTSGVGIASGTFQSSSNGSQYRIAVVGYQASTGSVNMYFDDFFVGPQTSAAGPAMSDWQAYTPTWTSTGSPSVGNGSLNGKWRRVGDSVEVAVDLNFGSTTSGAGNNWLFSLPPGLTIDSTKAPLNLAVGSAFATDAGTAFYAGVPIIVGNGVRIQAGGTSATQYGVTAPFTWGNGDILNFTASLPILGWSSNSVMSNDTDTRVVAASVQGAPVGVTSGNIAAMNQTLYDTHGATSPSRFTAPISGYYRVSGVARLSASVTSTLYLYKNGVINTELTGLNDTAGHGYSATVQLVAGDIIDLRPNNTVTFAALTFMIERVSGPATITATESVNLRYTSTAGTSLPAGTNTISFPSKSYDSHNSFTSNTTFTPQIGGKYSIKAKITTNTVVGVSTNSISILVNGSAVSTNVYALNYATASGYTFDIDDEISLLAGQTVTISFSNGFGVSVTMSAGVGQNTISITRVGN